MTHRANRRDVPYDDLDDSKKRRIIDAARAWSVDSDDSDALQDALDAATVPTLTLVYAVPKVHDLIVTGWQTQANYLTQPSGPITTMCDDPDGRSCWIVVPS